MLFNSVHFIFLFLPLVVLGFHLLVARGYASGAKVWLVIASLYFYAFWKLEYLPILILSILGNYNCGLLLTKYRRRYSATGLRWILAAGVSLNLLLLAYFKYLAFLLDILGSIASTSLTIDEVLLPLAISFFTFQQIAYLVDCYKGLSAEYKFLNYCVFVSFFPQLIAGPIVHHKQMMPQFESLRGFTYSAEKSVILLQGLFIFSIGLFKKVCVADTFATFANVGYAGASLNFAEAWMTSLSYTLQLYYDFSGYSDMAIGAALMFGIRLPINFLSPYKARNIQQFWRSWHITLSNWLRDYVFIPFGGSRGRQWFVCRNLLITFIVGGIWHGAGWTFIVWGALHGFAMMIHRLWRDMPIKMPGWIAWLITFNFVNFAWIFFRSESMEQAQWTIQAMVSPTLEGFSGNYIYQALLANDSPLFAIISTALNTGLLLLVLAVIAASQYLKNTAEISGYNDDSISEVSLPKTVLAGFAFSAAVLLILSGSPSVFLYFNF